VNIFNVVTGINAPTEMPIGKQIAEKNSIFQSRALSSACTNHRRESKMPPNTSAHMTMGIKK
jgi:hypothetical protein